MQIRDWMTKDVITASPETSMLKVSRMMKEYSIRRIPVVDKEGRVLGIVSDRDVRDASPSRATTLDMHELYYLLSEIKVRDIMSPNPITVNVSETVERVALLMLEKGVGGLPVIEDNGKLAGIITDHDLFKVLIQISGVRYGGVQLAIQVADLPGTIGPMLELLRQHNARLVSLLTSDANNGGSQLEIYLRIRPMERAAENKLIEEFKRNYQVLYWVRDNVHEVESRS